MKNIGANDAYVYLRVEVPLAKLTVLNEDGTTTTGETQLFTYEINSEYWEEIPEAKIDLGDSLIYTYYYKKAETTDSEGKVTRKENILKAGETTETLFDSVKFVNAEDISSLEQTQTVTIQAYAIQANNLPEGTTVLTTDWVKEWKELVVTDGVFKANISTSVKEKGFDYLILNISSTANKTVSKYQYSIDDGANWVDIANIDEELRIENLEEGIEYKVQIKAISESNKEVVSEIEVTTAQITANNYGDKINYSVTTNGVTLDDWKLFYNDEANDQVWMIYGGYMPNAGIDTTKTTLRTFGTYRAYWKDYKTTLTTPYNKSAVAELTNTENWSGLLTENLKTAGAKAYGGIDLEKYVASWNAKGYTKLYVSTNTTGYNVGILENPTTTVHTMKETIGYSDKLYYPYQNSLSDGDDKVNRYWLTSASAYNTYCVVFVGSDGRVGNSNYSVDGSNSAIRPAISIPSNLLVSQDADNAWNITE